MVNIMFLLAALVFALGALIGATLQTHVAGRRHRRVAQRVRELYELEQALREQDDALVARGPPHATYQGQLTGASHVAADR